MTQPAQPSGSALSGVARGGTVNILGAACNQLCLFAIVTLVARFLGGRALGGYTLCWALLVVVGLFALWGFQAALIRFVAIHLADRDPGRVRGTIRIGLSASVSLSAALAVGLFVLAPHLAGWFGDASLSVDLRLVAATLPGATLRDAALAATQGWRTQRSYALIGWVFEPLLRLALTCLVLACGGGLTAVFAMVPICSWCAAVLALLSLRRLMATVPPARPVTDTRAIWRFSTVSWGTVVASVGLIWADTLILGVLRSTQEVGVYNVATRLVNLAVFVMVPLNSSLAPQLARMLHAGESGPLAHAYSTATRWMLTLSLPAFVLLIVYAPDLLRVFGPEYVAGATVTVVLAVGQLVNTAAGPGGTLLNMSGHVRLNMANNAAVLILNVALNLALIPHYGIVGAAVAWSVSLGVVNIARIVQNRSLFAVFPFDRASYKSPAAAAVAAAVAVAVRMTMPGVVTRLGVGIVAGLGAYAVSLWVLGIEPDDRAALHSVAAVRRKPLSRPSAGLSVE